MAKKIVRGVTGVDNIESFDKTLTNVNDLISDGKNTYVHTKKGKNEFYYGYWYNYYGSGNHMGDLFSDNKKMVMEKKNNFFINSFYRGRNSAVWR